MSWFRSTRRRLHEAVTRPEEELTRAQRAMRFAYELSVQGTRQLIRDRAPQLAAALAYRTIFSLVPLIVLSLVVVKAWVGEEGIEKGLEQILSYTGLEQITIPEEGLTGEGAPQGGEGASGSGAGDAQAAGEATRLSEWLEQFVGKAMERVEELNYGAITVVGIAVLVYAAFSLLYQIEQSFNLIMRATARRGFLGRITNYWTLLTLGAVGLFATLGIREGYERVIEELPTWAAWATKPIQVGTRIGVTWLVLLFAYMRVPTARVAVRHAAAGAFAAAVLWDISKAAMALFIGGMVDSKAAVYGTLALLPLALFWIYLTWLLVLFGLEVSSALHMLKTGRPGRAEATGPSVVDASAGIGMMHNAARAFAEGRSCSLVELASGVDIEIDGARILADRLAERGLLHRLSEDGDVDDESEGDVYALARPAESITLSEIIRAVRREEEGGAGPKVGSIMTRVRDLERDALRDWTLAALVEREAGEGAEG